MRLGVIVVMAVVLVGCPSRDVDDDADDGGDVIADAGVDAGVDAGLDAGIDVIVDGGLDAGMCTRDVDCSPGQQCDNATGQCMPPEEPDLLCTTSADCLATELCHPTAKVCVQTCVSGADCPDSAKSCGELSPTDSRRVCKCSTDVLCNEGLSTFERVCSVADAVCTPKCTADEACGVGQRCDTATGHCQAWGGTGAPCSGEGQSNCDYGTHFCSSNVCTPLWEPSCANYTNFPNKELLGTTGPILHGARQVSTSTDVAVCGAATPKRVDVALSAYSSWGFPASRSALSGFFGVRVDGAARNGLDFIFPGNNYTVLGADQKRVEIIVSFCAQPASTTISGGFYFTTGNFLCFQANF
ncbi:hypothetical protein G4177_21770 [Corallococcus sp. ZKHCc1 1396]|uniref:Tryptophan synthase alpha chain n=1 Tax=Corallococcus soli TaxID=2710757 RepID=A0ABR9PSM7_9BACT|nr:hypothetical protein [Corallococcus soli]MBE4750802.1 hypothetical protein [Corallococcus soli]